MTLAALLESLEPVLHPGTYVFAVVQREAELADVEPLAIFREAEGLSVIVEESAAERARLTARFRAAWITLTVESDLDAVGLTAAVANALKEEGIACNVVAAVHHDHIFVPAAEGERALAVLRQMQERSRSGVPGF